MKPSRKCERSKGEADTLKEAKPRVYFATKNRGKFLEAARVADSFKISLKHLKFEKQEIQAWNLTEIASHAAFQAAKVTNKNVVAEDAGFFVRALNGFPGPYSSYVFKTLGLEGILRLMRNVGNREAYFQAAVAYCKPSHRPVCFTGIVKGRVARHKRGTQGFGYDPIFIPSGGDERTFAEMGTDEKNLNSHRAKAFARFCRWFLGRSHGVSSETS
jgi:XTP/dITP diphosphohydrolase